MQKNTTAMNFIDELTTSELLLRDAPFASIQFLVDKYFQNQNLSGKIKGYSLPSYHQNMISEKDVSENNNPFDAYQENSVVIIPIIGLMTKYSRVDWEQWKYVLGMDAVANLIRQADASDKIAGIILLTNTPGGTTQSIIQLEDALRNRTKPCIGLVDGMCCSAGIYTLSFCDKIFAINRMCEIGSIGTYTTIVDDTKYWEDKKIKIIKVYPPESKEKNAPVREAIKGKTDKLIKENLSPFAIHFQNTIKENRPKLITQDNGLLDGKVFYAYDAIKYKLIDGLKNIEQTIEEVKILSKNQKQLYSQLNK